MEVDAFSDNRLVLIYKNSQGIYELSHYSLVVPQIVNEVYGDGSTKIECMIDWLKNCSLDVGFYVGFKYYKSTNLGSKVLWSGFTQNISIESLSKIRNFALQLNAYCDDQLTSDSVGPLNRLNAYWSATKNIDSHGLSIEEQEALLSHLNHLTGWTKLDKLPYGIIDSDLLEAVKTLNGDLFLENKLAKKKCVLWVVFTWYFLPCICSCCTWRERCHYYPS